MLLLDAAELVKVYDRRRVVDRVSVTVEAGEIVGILGDNGAGKTTTFRMIVGMIRPDGGRVSLGGADLSRLPMYRRARLGIGYLTQEPSVFQRLTVEENVMAILETLPLPRAERRARLERHLAELGLVHLRGQRADRLSGGERRRLEVTRALVTGPKLMMLDEPFVGVSPIGRADIKELVAGLRGRGLGVLITDHDVREMLTLVDRAYILDRGKVLFAGAPREIMASEAVRAAYLGKDFRLAEVEAEGGRARP
ncbi:MAG: LPS export ABC transporter ATP-binding protein [Planctomycetes bacterium]|nr:LPS export ABC transporter ATP-binding protein [Planctomycetota bacterium]